MCALTWLQSSMRHQNLISSSICAFLQYLRNWIKKMNGKKHPATNKIFNSIVCFGVPLGGRRRLPCGHRSSILVPLLQIEGFCYIFSPVSSTTCRPGLLSECYPVRYTVLPRPLMKLIQNQRQISSPLILASCRIIRYAHKVDSNQYGYNPRQKSCPSSSIWLIFANAVTLRYYTASSSGNNQINQIERT